MAPCTASTAPVSTVDRRPAAPTRRRRASTRPHPTTRRCPAAAITARPPNAVGLDTPNGRRLARHGRCVEPVGLAAGRRHASRTVACQPDHARRQRPAGISSRRTADQPGSQPTRDQRARNQPGSTQSRRGDAGSDSRAVTSRIRSHGGRRRLAPGRGRRVAPGHGARGLAPERRRADRHRTTHANGRQHRHDAGASATTPGTPRQRSRQPGHRRTVTRRHARGRRHAEHACDGTAPSTHARTRRARMRTVTRRARMPTRQPRTPTPSTHATAPDARMRRDTPGRTTRRDSDEPPSTHGRTRRSTHARTRRARTRTDSAEHARRDAEHAVDDTPGHARNGTRRARTSRHRRTAQRHAPSTHSETPRHAPTRTPGTHDGHAGHARNVGHADTTHGHDTPGHARQRQDAPGRRHDPARHDTPGRTARRRRTRRGPDTARRHRCGDGRRTTLGGGGIGRIERAVRAGPVAPAARRRRGSPRSVDPAARPPRPATHVVVERTASRS